MTAPKTPVPPSPLDDILAFMRRYVAFPQPEQADVLALWALHTWAFDAAYQTPYIYITSAEMGSGKTRVIDTMEQIVRNPLRSVSMTESTMFRMIEASRPSLFLDEVDAVFNGGQSNEGLRLVLNGGYKRGGNVYRFVDGEPTPFATFSPKLLAGIDNATLPGTIQDRCIRIVLKRKRKDEHVERFFGRVVEQEAEPIRAKIEAWVAYNMDWLMDPANLPVPSDEFGDRQWEISEPLVQIALRCGKGWGDRARQSILCLFGQVESAKSPQARVLEEIRVVFGDRPTVLSSEIIERIGGDFTTKKLGVILKPYGITSQNVRLGATQAKGYHRRDFEDTWERYL